MTHHIITNPAPPGSPEWHRMISASKVPAILGLSRWQSQFALWHEMAGTVSVEPLVGEHLDWGHDVEASLAKWWLRHNPGWNLNVERDGRTELTYTDPALPFPNVATLDRRARRGRRFHIIECKTARDIDTWGQPGDPDAIPADYYAQVMFQMGVSGIRSASLVVLGFGTPEIHPVEFDPALYDAIVARCAAWWQSLDDGTPPDLDDHVTTYDTIRGMHPDIDRDAVVEIDALEAVALLNGVRAEDDGKADARAAKIRAAELMGAARLLKCGDVKIADRRSKAGGTPYVQFNKKADLQGVDA